MTVETVIDTPELRRQSMNLAFEEWLTTDPSQPMERDANYRNALLGTLAVADPISYYHPTAGLLNVLFTRGVREAAQRTGQDMPPFIPRKWSGASWRKVHRLLLNSLEATDKETESRSSVDYYQLLQAVQDGRLRYRADRQLLI